MTTTTATHMRESDRDKGQAPDRWLFLITLILLGFGVVMVFDASFVFATEIHGTPTYFLERQALWAVLGLGGMFLAMRVRFWKLAGLGVPAFLAAVAVLAAVLVIGHGALGAQRWLGVGAIRIQPSEFAKIAVVLFLAGVIAPRPHLARNLWGGVLPLLGAVLFVILLVELQPDLGTAITILLTSLLVFFTAGARKRWMITLLALFALGGVGLALRHGTDGYRWRRMITFINPATDPLGSGYQITHSMIALGTGHWTGIGFGESREKRLGNLPAQRTDFIFAIVGEEMGLAGTCGVLVLFFCLAARGYHIAARTKHPFGALLAAGITSMITVQALVNVGVVTASLPATGVPLPFLSYGGSALFTTLVGVGILLGISRYPDYRETVRRTRGQAAPEDAEGQTSERWERRRAAMGR